MSEVALTEQLDQAIEAMLRNPFTPLQAPGAQIAELLGVVVALRDLPRDDFKTRLRNDLERESSMNGLASEMDSADEPHSKVNPVRATFRTVTPYLTVADVHEEIEFVTRVFGAEGRIYGLGSAGGYHSEYRIGDSMVMIGGGCEGAHWTPTPAPPPPNPSFPTSPPF